MKRPPSPRAHLDTRVLLDYLDGTLAPEGRSRLEDHLASPCAACRERLRAVAHLVQTMREDRSAPPPEAIRARALEVFGVRSPAPAAATGPWRIASLLFDSLVDPVPAVTRRATGNARWLRFGLGDRVLEVELEPEGGGTWTLRGRLDLPDPALHRIEVSAGGERIASWVDTDGRFALDRVPSGGWTIAVRGPDRRFRLPPLAT